MQFANDVMQNMEALNMWLQQHPFVGMLVVAWLLTWKGLALWKAARKNHSIWFVVLLVVNLFSTLEILYYFIFSEWKKESHVDAHSHSHKEK
jgi:hypothetical protein